jgi:hypothetical protein
MNLTVQPDCRPEINLTFLQRMCNAMCMSLYKYGRIGDAYPHKVDAIATLKKRLELYEETGNLEWLVDVANMAMIEYTLPAHKEAHYAATDSKDSPGRKFHGELDSSKRNNKEI